MTPRKKSSDNKTEQPKKTAQAPKLKELQKEKKTCAYKQEIVEDNFFYPCNRPVWGKYGEEEFCIFHSEKLEEKKEEFKAEIEKFKRGETDQFLRETKQSNSQAGLGGPYFSFSGIRFPSGCANFKDHKFENPVDFNEAVFSDDAFFLKVIFIGNVNFQKAEFCGDAVFYSAEFRGMANFNKAKFHRKADFSSTAFIKEADFSGALFSGNVHFEILNSDEIFKFNYALFKNGVYFDYSKILSIEAVGISYKGKLSFYEFDFTKETKKDQCGNKSDFNGVELERARFVGTDLSSVAFGGAFIREVIFDRVSFGRAAECESWWKRWLQKPWLCGRPDEALWEERKARSIEGKGKKEKEERLKLFKSAETVYRTLKQMMKSQEAGQLSRRMHGCELEMRIRSTASSIERGLLRVYRFLNGFGLRWLRTLVFWVFCLLVFTCGYWGHAAYYERLNPWTGDMERVEKYMEFHEAFWHSLEVSSILARPTMSFTDRKVWWIAGAEKIISPFLLLLLLQAAGHKLRD